MIIIQGLFALTLDCKVRCEDSSQPQRKTTFAGTVLQVFPNRYIMGYVVSMLLLDSESTFETIFPEQSSNLNKITTNNTCLIISIDSLLAKQLVST